MIAALGRPRWLLMSLLFIIAAVCLLVGIGLNGRAAAEGPVSGTVPVRLEIEPVKRIYSSREGIMVKFIFTAQARTKLCLEKDVLSQMQVNFYRPGVGKLPVQPLVLRDNKEIFKEKPKVQWLESGESLTLRANLKRFRFAGGEHWIPGEYSVGATFNLCEQTEDVEVSDEGLEIPVKTTRQGWFMIMS